MTLFLVLSLLTLAAAAVSFRKDPDRTRLGLRKGVRSLAGIAPMILGLTAAIGFLLALIPQDTLAGLLARHDAGSFFLVAGIGAVAAIPAPVAFPLAGSLMALGAGTGAVATFITTLTMVSVVSLPMEAEHFGRRFALLRQGVSFLLAVAIGAIMGVLL